MYSVISKKTETENCICRENKATTRRFLCVPSLQPNHTKADVINRVVDEKFSGIWNLPEDVVDRSLGLCE